MLFVSRFLLLTRRAFGLLLFGFRGLCLRLLFRWFSFLLTVRRFHVRLSRWRRDLLFLWLLLIGLARILSRWLLGVTEHSQTHEQSKNRSKPDALHTVLLVSVTSSCAKQPKIRCESLPSRIRPIVISRRT